MAIGSCHGDWTDIHGLPLVLMRLDLALSCLAQLKETTLQLIGISELTLLR